MNNTKYIAFYPSQPFWAVQKINFSEKQAGNWFRQTMSEDMFSDEKTTHSLKISRDGRISIRVNHIEDAIDAISDDNLDIDSDIKNWSQYLDYLNSFFLFLDSSVIEIDRIAIFQLYEITNRDAFRVTIDENGETVGESIAINSPTGRLQLGRYSPRDSLEHIEYSSDIQMRSIISYAAIKMASDNFSKAISDIGTIKTTSSFSKSLSEYKIGNYSSSILTSWFIVESSMNIMWENHLKSLNNDEEVRRINKDRRKFLNGRDFTASIVSNLLELWEIIPFDIFNHIEDIRKYRNSIVHGLPFDPSADECRKALITANFFIERLWNVKIKLNTSLTIPGL